MQALPRKSSGNVESQGCAVDERVRGGERVRFLDRERVRFLERSYVFGRMRERFFDRALVEQFRT